MPIYEYACDTCGETLEVIHGISVPGPDVHEGCGGKLQRLVSAPTNRVSERAAAAGSTDSMLRFRENSKIAAEKQKKR
jgi:putative FmdB family regulatory protein